MTLRITNENFYELFPWAKTSSYIEDKISECKHDFDSLTEFILAPLIDYLINDPDQRHKEFILYHLINLARADATRKEVDRSKKSAGSIPDQL